MWFNVKNHGVLYSNRKSLIELLNTVIILLTKAICYSNYDSGYNDSRLKYKILISVVSTKSSEIYFYLIVSKLLFDKNYFVRRIVSNNVTILVNLVHKRAEYYQSQIWVTIIYIPACYFCSVMFYYVWCGVPFYFSFAIKIFKFKIAILYLFVCY